ncbi:MAG: SufD family Fe-S cluster assembly protein [Patescibacteria group bacterium]
MQTQANAVSTRLIPLSEDSRLSLALPRELRVMAGETHVWDEVTVIARGERRVISLDVQLEAGAVGQMTRIFEVPEGARLHIFHQVQLEAGASWQNALCIRGSGEVTIRRAIKVSGNGARVALACAAVMDKKSHISVADEVFVESPNVQAKVDTKIVLKQAAKSEVRARQVVGHEARGSLAYERVGHLLLSPQAVAACIPELEVKTDEVECGHAATFSEPDEAEIFYLMSRGLIREVALGVVARGFVNAALSAVTEPWREKASQVLFADYV